MKNQIKLTKRRDFKFYRSYFDVFTMLENDADKLEFVSALLDAQFTGVKPNFENNPMLNFAWNSQIHSIEQQIKGYQDKTKTILTPDKGGHEGGDKGGSVQHTTNNKQQTTNNDVLPFKQIVDHLNSTCGTNYKHTSSATKTKITARINEGFTVDDFKRVIDFKNNEWANDQKMKSFLRPETLFGTKFESYLNNAPTITAKQKSTLTFSAVQYQTEMDKKPQFRNQQVVDTYERETKGGDNG